MKIYRSESSKIDTDTTRVTVSTIRPNVRIVSFCGMRGIVTAPSILNLSQNKWTCLSRSDYELHVNLLEYKPNQR